MKYGISVKEWKILREKVFKRDNGICQLCGAKGWLCVHHKIPFRISRDNSMDNLITLCKVCHSTQHTNKKIRGQMEDIGFPRNIKKYIAPKWHEWVYGGAKNPNL